MPALRPGRGPALRPGRGRARRLTYARALTRGTGRAEDGTDGWLEHCGTRPSAWEVTGHIDEHSSETRHAGCTPPSCYTRIVHVFLHSYLPSFTWDYLATLTLVKSGVNGPSGTVLVRTGRDWSKGTRGFIHCSFKNGAFYV